MFCFGTFLIVKNHSWVLINMYMLKFLFSHIVGFFFSLAHQQHTAAQNGQICFISALTTIHDVSHCRMQVL